MRRIYISTTNRGEDFNELTHGSLYLVDWDTKEILKKRNVFPRAFCSRNGNPRGGTRGWRGITSYGNSIVVANSDSLVFFSEDLEHISKVITHPSFSNIHELSSGGSEIAITVTGTDSVAMCNWSGDIEIFPLLKDDEIWELVRPWVEKKNRPRFVPDSEYDYREEFREDNLHFNTLESAPDGSIYAIFNTYHMIVQLHPEKRIVLAPPLENMDADAQIKNPHNMIFITSTEAVVCSSHESALYTVHLDTGKYSKFFQNPENKDSDIDLIRYGWLRGLDWSKGHIFTGCGQATLIEIDTVTGKELDRYTFAPDTVESTFSIHLHPDDWT